MTPPADPRVSVVIPTHNRVHLLPRALQSVRDQTFKDIEIIIVDDGSTDGTQEYVSALGDPLVRYVRHDVGKGGSAARNTGMDHARGQYIAFLDDDDEWTPRKLEWQVAALDSAAKHVVLSYGWRDYVNDSTGERTPGPRGTQQGDISDFMLRQGIPSPTSTYVVRTECARRLRFDESLPMGQDMDFMTRLSQRWHVVLVPEVLMMMHIGHGPRVSNLPGYHNLKLNNLRRHTEVYEEELRQRPEIMAHLLGQMAIRELLRNRWNLPAALKHYLRALRIAPMFTMSITVRRLTLLAHILLRSLRG